MVRLLHHLSSSEHPHSFDVSIPQWCDCCTTLSFRPLPTHCRFNPTMVRLLRNDKDFTVRVKKEFQSHNGAIAATCRLKRGHEGRQFQSHNGAIAAISFISRISVYVRFQSHNGAIAACLAGNCRRHRCGVSIPQWCDCCNPDSQFSAT